MNHAHVLLPSLALRGVSAVIVALVSVHPADAGSGMVMPGMQHGQTTSKKFAFGEPGKSSKANRTVTIVMTDDRFEPASLEVRVGETIRFILKNTSALDHDFTLGDGATQKAHRAEMAEMANEGGEMQHMDDPNAAYVKAGEAGELTWKFSRAGRLEFDCNVPGHYEAGMAGTISVVRN